MAWSIECTNCGKVSNPANIVELMEKHRDNPGPWSPYLKGIIRVQNQPELNTSSRSSSYTT